MRRDSFLLSLIVAGTGLCIQPALAQTPGQIPGQQPPMGQQPQRPIPGQTDPMGRRDPTVNPNADTTPAMKVDDKKFLKDAAMGGLTEVELGKIAVQKASSDAVKQFGQKMIDDHSKANEHLKHVAKQESISVPEELDSKHRSRVDKLSKLSGADFDKAYMKDQLKDHQQDVREFQLEAQNGTDPNVKGFAVKTLPTLQAHLNMAKDISKEVK